MAAFRKRRQIAAAPGFPDRDRKAGTPGVSQNPSEHQETRSTGSHHTFGLLSGALGRKRPIGTASGLLYEVARYLPSGALASERYGLDSAGFVGEVRPELDDFIIPDGAARKRVGLRHVLEGARGSRSERQSDRLNCRSPL